MKIYLIAAAVFLSLTAQAFAGAGDQILGTWSNEDGKAKVNIFDCGGSYCGKIVWLREPDYPRGDKRGMAGKPRVDRDNPDRTKRGRQLLGLQIMEGFVYSGNDVWSKGRIYDPESGKTYKGKITLVSPKRLHLRGYVGIPLFGRSTTWTR